MVIETMGNPLWLELSDFFYQNKCTNGYIDPDRPNYHSFIKNKKIYQITRIDYDCYCLKVVDTGEIPFIEENYNRIRSICEVEQLILSIMKRGKK